MKHIVFAAAMLAAAPVLAQTPPPAITLTGPETQALISYLARSGHSRLFRRPPARL